MKIGPVDNEIALLQVKKGEINASKIFSPVGNLAKRAKKKKKRKKLMQEKYITLPASLPSRLNYKCVAKPSV